MFIYLFLGFCIGVVFSTFIRTDYSGRTKHHNLSPSVERKIKKELKRKYRLDNSTSHSKEKE